MDEYYKLEQLKLEHISSIKQFLEKRPLKSCEYNPVTLFMYQKVYQPRIYQDSKCLIIYQSYEQEIYALMPLSEQLDIAYSFGVVQRFFEKSKLPLRIYCADQTYIQELQHQYPNQFYVSDPELSLNTVVQAEADKDLLSNRHERYQVGSNPDYWDYIYCRDQLVNLSGKKLRKKKNHINGFLREYEGRFCYRNISKADIPEIIDYLQRWQEQQERPKAHQSEIESIRQLLELEQELNYRMAGVWIDQKLGAFTIGSCHEQQSVVIHIEKANKNIRGLYAYINRQFLIHAFPKVALVNREDDLGIEGLRKAKHSYAPIQFEKKYDIQEIRG